MEEIGLYIHIPFCNSKCFYCDFVSFPKIDDKVSSYIDFLIEEMSLYKEIMEKYIVKTIFIGGGTPSYIDSSYIGKILNYIYENFNTDLVEEITIECNPGTLSREKLEVYKGLGINRLSLGLQTLNDELLKSIGRSHTCEDFYKNYNLIRKIGFENINVDLMFGLPGQRLIDIEETLNKIVDLDIEHISFYSLILEENTLLNTWYDQGKIELPDEDLERQMYYEGIKILNDNGYDHYEISNFAKKGLESQHNLLYWELKPYLAFGISAHSNIDNKRFGNYNDFKSYYNSLENLKFPRQGEEYIEKDMEMAEYLIMGLRLIQGISKEDFYNRFGVEIEKVYGHVLKKYEKQKLLYIDEERVRFTSKGLDLSNVVLVDLLP